MTDHHPQEVERHRPSQISWGAIIAGLAIVIAGSWLLFLLGSAIGLGIADATDGAAVGDGLSTGAIAWMLITSIVVFYIGAYAAGRLTGKTDKSVGFLHGATVWSTGTALMVILGYFGVASFVQTGQNLVSASLAMGSSAMEDDKYVRLSELENSPLLTTLKAGLKRQAATRLSERQTSEQGSSLATAADDIDAEAFTLMASRITEGDFEGAKEELVQYLDIEESELDNIINNISNQAKDILPNETVENLSREIQNRVQTELGQAIANADASGGTEVTAQEAQQALGQLDNEVLSEVSKALIQGNTEAATQTLAGNTNLSEAEINEIVEGINNEFNQQVNALQNQVSEVAGQMKDWLSSSIADLDAQGGAQVNADEIEQALEQLNADNLQAVAIQLAQGNVQGAKDELVINTNLSEAEINDIVDGVQNSLNQQIQELKQSFNSAVETTTDYGQIALWLAFATSLVGLIVSLFGGMVGARQAQAV